MSAVINLEPPPLQKGYHPIFATYQLQVDVLRLDAMHPVVGGNKWMKLLPFLQQAVADQRTGVFTKGGPWSNHVQAVAWACHQMGLPFTAWIKGHAGLQTAMLDDVRAWGGTVRFVNQKLFYTEAVAIAVASANNLLYIPMGGEDDRAVQECSRFFQNLSLPMYNYAVCAVGTATTLGGLAFVPHNFSTVVGVDAGTKDTAAATKMNRWQQTLPHKRILHLQAYTFGGFARHTAELLRFVNDLYRQTGIPTDVVYTAKLFYAVQQLAQKGFFAKGSSVMVLHSGGLQGNRSLPAGTLQF